MFRTKIVRVSSDEQLGKAIIESGANRFMRAGGMNGERHIILVEAGTYRIKEEMWPAMVRSIVVGDMSGTKPIFLIENSTAVLIAKNMFMNIHFKIVNGCLTLNLLENPVLFLQCKFESYSPSRNDKNISSEELHQRLAQKMQRANDMTVEEYELRERSQEELTKEMKISQTMNIDGNPTPAVVVITGQCAMIRCEISDCLGAGALVCKSDEQTIEPVLYMKSCRIRNCQMSGAEVREGGRLVLEDCDISSNSNGVFAWKNASSVKIQSCNINSNANEGIHGAGLDFSYDNSTRLVVEGGSVHHNQIGLSLEFLKNVDVSNCKVFSNRSWGIYMRNSNIASIRENNIFRNDCGGIRVCFNRFEFTVVMKNMIHDHTGPDIVQTSYLSEKQEQQDHVGLDRTVNSIPIMIFNNFSYNNELSYGSVSEWRVSVEKPCHFCNRANPQLECKKCRKVMYCNETCRREDYLQKHKTFCDYFTQNNLTRLFLQPQNDIIPCNQLIPNRKKKMKLRDYKGKEFLVKIASGDNCFGQADALLTSLMQRMPKKNCVDVHGISDNLLIYDEFRFVCGTVTGDNKEILNLVRQFGKLSGEKIYNKRIYLKARIMKGNKNELLVDTTQLYHEQGW